MPEKVTNFSDLIAMWDETVVVLNPYLAPNTIEVSAQIFEKLKRLPTKKKQPSAEATQCPEK